MAFSQRFEHIFLYEEQVHAIHQLISEYEKDGYELITIQYRATPYTVYAENSWNDREYYGHRAAMKRPVT